ncbi:unnamed protein product [Amoebophrya sp. A25]|nr:unnamed protein product [Amoebophrya sp. A25]|eukprot:GSA25T00000638001.1
MGNGVKRTQESNAHKIYIHSFKQILQTIILLNRKVTVSTLLLLRVGATILIWYLWYSQSPHCDVPLYALLMMKPVPQILLTVNLDDMLEKSRKRLNEQTETMKNRWDTISSITLFSRQLVATFLRYFSLNKSKTCSFFSSLFESCAVT